VTAFDKPTPPATSFDLTSLLASRRWVRRARPFPHILAGNVFTPPFYAELAAHFERIQRERPEAFARNMAGYDAAGAELRHNLDGPLAVFASRQWHDMLARLTGIPATGDVSASLHHHAPGGASGWPHNDLNPGWFPPRTADADSVVLAGTDGVGYHKGVDGDGRPAPDARETVRALSILFYLANPQWQPGDGGETGLYTRQGADRPDAAVPPVNNSMVIFECTPFSWHGFISNRRTDRNCVVMWLHRDKAEAVARWGEQSIVYW
jgi:hypothetical protein